MQKDESRLYELLTTKEYDELSTEEQEFVNISCGKATYQMLRFAEKSSLGASKIANENISPKVKQNLMQAWEQNNRLPLWKHPIPAYQVAAGLALFCLLAFWPHQKPSQSQIVYIDKVIHDTVYPKIPAISQIEPDNNVRPKFKNHKKSKPSPQMKDTPTPDNLALSKSGIQVTPYKDYEKGITLGEDSLNTQFLTSIY